MGDLRRTIEIASPNPWGSIEPRLRTTGLNKVYVWKYLATGCRMRVYGLLSPSTLRSTYMPMILWLKIHMELNFINIFFVKYLHLDTRLILLRPMSAMKCNLNTATGGILCETRLSICDVFGAGACHTGKHFSM